MALKGLDRFNELIGRGVRRVRRAKPQLVVDNTPTPAQQRLAALAMWANDPICSAHFVPELKGRIQLLDNRIDEEYEHHAILIEAIGERKALRNLLALFVNKLIQRGTS